MYKDMYNIQKAKNKTYYNELRIKVVPQKLCQES